jgi:TPR repeat protein
MAACSPKPNPRFKPFPPSTVSYKDSFETIKAAADSGDISAMRLLGDHFGIIRDKGGMTEEESNIYLFKAAEAGEPFAQIELAQQYAQKIPPQHTLPNGPPPKMKWRDGFKQDYAKSLYWMHRMACDRAQYFPLIIWQHCMVGYHLPISPLRSGRWSNRM